MASGSKVVEFTVSPVSRFRLRLQGLEFVVYERFGCRVSSFEVQGSCYRDCFCCVWVLGLRV